MPCTQLFVRWQCGFRLYGPHFRCTCSLVRVFYNVNGNFFHINAVTIRSLLCIQHLLLGLLIACFAWNICWSCYMYILAALLLRSCTPSKSRSVIEWCRCVGMCSCASWPAQAPRTTARARLPAEQTGESSSPKSEHNLWDDLTAIQQAADWCTEGLILVNATVFHYVLVFCWCTL